MPVDTRLRAYWNNVFLWRQTKATVWLELLKVMAESDEGPSGRAAKRVVNVA